MRCRRAPSGRGVHRDGAATGSLDRLDGDEREADALPILAAQEWGTRVLCQVVGGPATDTL